MFIIIVAGVVFITSCYTSYYSVDIQNSNLEEVEIEVLRPAIVDIPTKYYKVLFIKNRNIKNETRLIEFDRFNETKKEFFLSTQSLDNYCEELSYHFQNLPKFDIINKNVFPLGIYKGDSINWDSLQLVCRLNEADAAIVISSYKPQILAKTDFNPNSFFFVLYFQYNFSYAITSEMLFIDPFEKKIIDKITLHNYQTWIEERDYQLNIPTYCLNITNYLNTYPAQLAEKYSKRISPYWSLEYRKFYGSMNSRFNTATLFIRNNEWEKAKLVWLHYNDSTSRNLENRANYNLILAYEMEGNLDKALQQAQKSYYGYKNYYGQQYSELIQERMRDQDILKKQLGED